jgi:hypothetical protein
LVVEWADTIYQQTEDDDQRDLYVATRAAQWGADQELQAVCQLLFSDSSTSYTLSEIRAARRPKPPSLKEQALAVLDDVSDRLDAAHENAIRRALEALPE